MKSLLKLPLHYQILIALVVGTVLGVATNPGEIELPDASGVVQPAEGGGFTLIEQDPQGRPILEETFPGEKAFRDRYGRLAEAYFQAGGGEMRFDVRRRRVHISERMEEVSLEYKRRFVHGRFEQFAVANRQAGSGGELKTKFPHWSDAYDEYASRLGGLSRQVSIWSKWIGDLFLQLLKMITVPLIVTSLVTGVAGLGDTQRFGAMFGRTILYYAVTSMLAITTGIVMVNLVRPGVGVDLPGGGEGAIAGQDQTLAGVFTGLVGSMFPENPVHALAEGQFLSIITFSILFGMFIIYTGGGAGRRMREFFEAAFKVMMNFTLFIIKLAPIGVLAFMTYATVSQGLEIFVTLARYIIAVFLSLMVHACITLPLIIKFVARRSPVEYFKAMSPALMTAFSTASSNGTLPLTISCVEERAGVSNRVSSFVLPLGATINMDGTALYEAVAVMFIAQATPGFELTFDKQIMVAITALLASVGAAGIPHAGLVMMAIVLQAVGLPLEAQGIIIAVDRVLDMFRTSVNVWSDSCGCAVVARFEGDAASIDNDEIRMTKE